MKNVDLNELSKKLRSIINVDEIDINKKMSKVYSDARHNSKASKCLVCEKSDVKFCNSHSIPQFCLRNISSTGKLSTTNEVIDMRFFLKKTAGINEAGTFKNICTGCDSTIFQDYEKPETYEKQPDNKVLSEIALKCSLRMIYKRNVEIEVYKQMLKIGSNQQAKSLIRTFSSDLVDYTEDFKKAKSNVKSSVGNGYYLVYYKVLDYVVPYAFQSQITLHVDLENKIVNNIYSYKENYHMKDLYICVFPLKASTAIIVFIDNNEKRYKNFIKQFRKLSEIDKLALINFIILRNSEEVFYSDDASFRKVLKSNDLKKLCGNTNNLELTTNDLFDSNLIEGVKVNSSLQDYKKYPNLLSEDYKLR